MNSDDSGCNKSTPANPNAPKWDGPDIFEMIKAGVKTWPPVEDPKKVIRFPNPASEPS